MTSFRAGPGASFDLARKHHGIAIVLGRGDSTISDGSARHFTAGHRDRILVNAIHQVTSGRIIPR